MIYQIIIFEEGFMNLCVIFGGVSCEHDVSIITGLQCVANIDSEVYNVVPIYIDRDGIWWTGECLKDVDYFNYGDFGRKSLLRCVFVPGSRGLYIKKGKKYKYLIDIDVSILCLHGGAGENGVVAGVMEMSNIPYSSSSNLASSVSMDKVVFKCVMKGLGVDVVKGLSFCYQDMMLRHDDILNEVEEKIGFPVIVKPSKLGSSIGIGVCRCRDDFANCLQQGFKYDNKVLVEEYLSVDKEINIAVVDNKGELVFSNTETPISNGDILSFDDKYVSSPNGFEGIGRKIPADISVEQLSMVKDVAGKVYRGLEMFGVVRFDFLLGVNGKLYLNEVNTIPGSLGNYLFDKKSLSYRGLIDLIVSNAINRKDKDERPVKTFSCEMNYANVDILKK